MPQIGQVNKFILYAQPLIDEKMSVAVDMPATCNTWYVSENQLETEKSDFYSDEDEKRKLFSEQHNYFHKSPVNLEWRNISLTIPKNKKILDGLNGSAHNGELTAIMGPSGAGKTSLINILTGFTRQNASGQVLVNGVNRDMKSFRKNSCYIMQDNYLFEHLTVRESIYFAACLKIPSSVSKKGRNKAVDECMQSLGLTEKQNNRANQLSGGQRKRLCIAQELVSNPLLIFLDEPTSGLDSSSCLRCIQLLKSLADEGRTVVCTIHQPSAKILELFDKLYMLADGQCIYRGPTQNLVPFLAKQGLICPQYHNPTDYVMEVACGDHGDWTWKLKKAVECMNDLSKDSSLGVHSTNKGKQERGLCTSILYLFRDKVDEKSSIAQNNYLGYSTSAFNQLRVLTYRNFICTIREPLAMQTRLISHVSVGLLFGMLFYGIGNNASKIFTNTNFLFASLIFLTFTAKMATVLTFPIEKMIFEREHLNSWYSTEMYYLSKTITEIPFQILFPAIYCSIVYFMTAQPNDLIRFGLFLLSFIMTSLVSQSFGLLISASATIQNAVFLGPIVNIPTLLFSGFLISLRDMPFYLRWLSHISYVRYSFESVLLGIYSLDRQELQCGKKFCLFQKPMDYLKARDMVNGNLYVDYTALLGFFLVLRLTTYYILWYRVMYTR